jgi:arabinogalactan oligomer/maltooligosaccharide transport system substrate-binding protein
MNALRKMSILLLVAIVTVAAFGVMPQKTDAQGGQLVIWHAWQDAEKELLDTWVANFSAANPDIAVETRFVPFDDLRSTYENAAATGEGPDLLIGQADWAGGLSEAGLIQPLDALLEGSDLAGQVSDAGWDTMSYKGSRYGVAVTYDGLSLYYNSDLIDPDDVPETLEDLIATGLELTEGDDVGLLFNNGFYHTAGIYFALGGQLFDVDGQNLWNTDEAAVDYLTIHQTVFNEAPGLISGDNAIFREGRAAMIIDGSWNLGTYKGDLGDSLGVALLPEVNGEPWSPFVGGKGFYLNSTSENVDEALAFLTYVTSPEGFSYSPAAGHIPTGVGLELDDPLVNAFAEQFSLGTALPTDPAMGAYWEPMGNAINAVTEGGEDPAAAAAAAEATVLEKLAPPATDDGDMGEMGTIVDVAMEAGNLSTLITAVTAGGLVETLAGEGPYTVFAPIDESFATLPPGTLEAVLADPALLTQILTFHVVPGEYSAEDLMGMTSLPTVLGVDLVVEVDADGNIVLGGGQATVVTADLHASNGIIHLIDGVLVP